jgi:hypothetical protein
VALRPVLVQAASKLHELPECLLFSEGSTGKNCRKGSPVDEKDVMLALFDAIESGPGHDDFYALVDRRSLLDLMDFRPMDEAVPRQQKMMIPAQIEEILLRRKTAG